MPKKTESTKKEEMILLLRMGSSGYSVWREDDLSVAGRFTTKRKAKAYLKKLAEINDGEVDGDQVSLENDIYQIVVVDLENVPLDPVPDATEDAEEEEAA